MLKSSLLAVAAFAVVGAPASALAAPHAADVVGHVYVNDNTPGTNTIAAFDRSADGSLSPIAGSPFRSGGAGTGAGLGSQGAVQTSSDGRFVIAADAGSNELSVLRVKSDGDLKQVPGGTVSSGGLRPVSIAVHGNLVYVANAGDGGSNYTGFTLDRVGRLAPVAGSAVAVPDGSQLGDVLFNADGTRLIGTRVNTSLIDSFTVGENGVLTAAPGSPYSAQGVGPFGSAFRPTNANQLFVTNAHNGANLGTVSAFTDAANGVLSPIGSSPFANGQSGTCWLEVSPDGQSLVAINTGSGTISRYAIAPSGELTLAGNTALSAANGVGATDSRFAPNGRTLYVNESRADAIGVFAADGTTLTETSGGPVALPAGAAPVGIAVQ
jgi:6-phosphogluconolactonase (cycloisomerase 2 family)